MDITAKWSSCVERVKSKRPQERKATRNVEKTDGSKILQSYMQIFSNMKALHKFLSANKFKYISSNECHLWSPASNMDHERFKIDNETKELIQLYKEEIESEAQHLKKVTKTNDQRSLNSALILEFLEKYSVMLQACMSDMQLKLNLNKLTHVDYTVKAKAARMQGSLLDGKQYEKMNENLDKKHFPKRSIYASDPIDDDTDDAIASSSTTNNFGSRDSLRTKKSTSAANLNSNGNPGNLSPRKESKTRLRSSREFDDDANNNSASNGASGNMSETKREELMLENKQLVDKLETITSQINEVQHQIMFLSQATSLMAEHVEQQAESIDSMLVQTEESRENFGRGNRNIQKAKATAGDFRLCTITLLIFLSFSLLFLHWIH